MNTRRKQKSVLVGGCFDVLHFGHISFLKNAKAHGNYLIIALESDENVRRMKGPSRPIHTQDQRRQMLLSTKFVNEVIDLPPMNSDSAYLDMVNRIKPDVIAVTDGDPITAKKQSQADAVRATFVIVPKIHTPSTSQLAKLIGLE